MSKLLFIQYRPFGAVMNGGDQGTKKNLDADAWCRALYADDYMTPVKNWDLKNIKTRHKWTGERCYRSDFK